MTIPIIRVQCPSPCPDQPQLPVVEATFRHMLQLSFKDGSGYFPACRNQLIGPGQRYKILRMLGAGTYSIAYLVEDLWFVLPL